MIGFHHSFYCSDLAPWLPLWGSWHGEAVPEGVRSECSHSIFEFSPLASLKEGGKGCETIETTFLLLMKADTLNTNLSG